MLLVRCTTTNEDTARSIGISTVAPTCTPTPVRYAVYPWIATVTQGQMDSFEGVA
jgi:hypothetical protein